MSIDLLAVLMDYAGVIVGAVLLAVGSMFLPSEARKYVLTAGIALIVFRTWQIYRNRQRLEEADRMRDQLREQVDGLNQQLAGLRDETEALRREKAEILARQRALQAEREALDASSDQAMERKAELDAEADRLAQSADEVQQRLRERRESLEAAAELGRKFAQ